MKNRTPLIIGLIVLALIIVLVVRIGGNGGKETISITVPYPDSVIFLDEEEYKRTSSENEIVKVRAEVGLHTVVVAGEALWPWTETIDVRADADLSYHAFTLPQSASGFILTAEDQEHPTVLGEFSKYTLPREQTKLISADEKVALWVGSNDRQILVEWLGDEAERPSYFCNERGCFNTTSVFIGVSEIRSISFIPGRADVVLIARASCGR